jgi:hypothetical protein
MEPVPPHLRVALHVEGPELQHERGRLIDLVALRFARRCAIDNSLKSLKGGVGARHQHLVLLRVQHVLEHVGAL